MTADQDALEAADDTRPEPVVTPEALAAWTNIVRMLDPLTYEQRRRVLRAAACLLGVNPL